ncbi:hypothetical protein Tco_1435674 [Tanacetum coccineum]
MTQSQPTESTQGTNMTPSALMPPNAQEQQGESSALKKSTIIRIPRRKQPHPATPILTAEKINVDNLDEATQIRIAIARSAEEYKAQQAIKKVDEHLMDEDIKKLVEGEYSDANKFDEDMINTQEYPDTKIDPGSHKESPKAKKVADYMSIDEEMEEESTEVVLIRRKGKVSWRWIHPSPYLLDPLGLLLILNLQIRKNSKT